ncbi:hypothetical protein [Streptomyces sp. CAU 1734]|uniref:hypothetical protein n=1 Tax=Streptomyces sp. CAU 1734 TaxID=3140360 RepID=UPI003260666C
MNTTCPLCPGHLAPASPGWHRCTVCAYETSDEAHRLYTAQAERFETDPAAFFAEVRARLDELISREPVWQR